MTHLDPLDVSPRRREDLRARCRSVLLAQADGRSSTRWFWMRVVGPGIAVSWGTAYALQAVRLALAYA